VFGIATRYGLGGPEFEIIHPASYTMGIVPFPEVKRSGRGLNHLALKLKKEQKYTSTPSLSLRGLF
jgi:hypothetical protein